MTLTLTAPATPEVSDGRVRLEVVDLHRSYDAVRALDGLSFAVRAGRVTGFLGRNGAGKSTAMRVVLGVANPDAGAVRWDGTRVDAAIRRRFGYLPEQRALYPRMTAVDEIVYFGRLRGMAVSDATRAAQALLYELDLSHRASERVDRLSHGNQQRLQLATALVHDPELLVLDEPFSGLDPAGIDAMAGLLRARAGVGASILFSSHQLDVVEHLCDDVVIIDAGRTVLAGDLDDVQQRGPRTLVVAVSGAAVGWQRALSPDAVLDRTGRARLRLADGDDVGRLLEAARELGSVTHFGLERPLLSELFREAVRQ